MKYSSALTLMTAIVLSAATTVFLSGCKGSIQDPGTPPATQEHADHEGDHAEGHEAGHSDAEGEGHEDGHMEAMQSIGGHTIASGSVEADIFEFTNNGTGSMVFILDKIPMNDEDELSAEGKAQLDVLASLLQNNEGMLCEIQGHTAQADNGVGRTAKKGASKTRAMFVKAKLVLRGVKGENLTAKGYADEQLLTDLDPKDDGQKRLAVMLSH